jgi:hypothetical protein
MRTARAERAYGARGGRRIVRAADQLPPSTAARRALRSARAQPPRRTARATLAGRSGGRDNCGLSRPRHLLSARQDASSRSTDASVDDSPLRSDADQRVLRSSPPYPVLFAAADLERSAQREPRSLCGVERCRLHPAREVRRNLSKSSCAGSVLPLGILGRASVGFL